MPGPRILKEVRPFLSVRQWPPTIREIRGTRRQAIRTTALDAIAANYAVLRAKWKKFHGRFS